MSNLLTDLGANMSDVECAEHAKAAVIDLL